MDIYQKRTMPKRKDMLLNISRIIILIAAVGLQFYSTVTGNFELMSIIFFVAGGFMLGFSESEKNRKKKIIMTILTAVLIFFSIYFYLD